VTQGGSRPRTLDRGESLGRYVVLSKLGAGGMGVVYAAYDPELDRKVALKVLLPESSGGSSAGTDGSPRLVREAQALARLTHPNVITVHDVGTVGGSVFIAMEFVDGVTLTEWLKKPRRWREVITVALAAGRGIAAAHSVGIVHRDFKPDNVMIGTDDRVRVLDFGLARSAGGSERESDPDEEAQEVLESAPSTLDSKLTQTGAMMGTPAYMAPEQHLGKKVDERSDQFAFCVSLYEALYGERPFAGESFAALAFQVVQGKVREAPKASKVPGWLRRELLRGLKPKPRDRHASMDVLLRALARDPWRTRSRIGIGVALLGVFGVLGASLQRASDDPPLCTGAEAHLDGVWDDAARAEIGSAFEATGLPFAASTLETIEDEVSAYAGAWVDAKREACEDTRVRGEQSDEVLTLRNACLDRRLQQVQALVGLWRKADALTVERAIEASQSLSPIADCNDLERLALGVRLPEDPQIRTEVTELQKSVDAANALYASGKPKQARELLESIRADVEALGYRPLRAEHGLVLAVLTQDPNERVRLLEEAVWMAEAGRHDRVVVSGWSHLVRAYAFDTNDFEAAGDAVRRAEAAIERLGGDEEASIRLMVNHGEFLNVAEESERAVELLREARDRRARLSATATPQSLQELMPLANALMELSEYEEPAEFLRAAVPKAKEVLGPNHPWTARILATLGRAQYKTDALEEAERSLTEAIEIFDRAYGPDSRMAASCLNGLALVVEDLGRVDEARDAYRRALSIIEAAMGPRHLNAAKISGNIARLESRLGDSEAAIERQKKVLEIKREIYADENLEIAFTLDNLGQIQFEADHDVESLKSYREAVGLIERIKGPDDDNLVYSLTGVGQALLELGRAKEARQNSERAMAILRRNEAKLWETTAAWAKFTYARALWESGGEKERARNIAIEARDEYAKASAYYQTETAKVEAWLDAHGGSVVKMDAG
jgi:tetratricopeptide (TPR) repeat protein